MKRAVILFGHGSRDPLWRVPMDDVAGRIRSAGVPAECAFLELQPPDLVTAAAAAVDAGAELVTVLPMFLGTGKHAREDFPVLVAAMRAAHPDAIFDIRLPVGEDVRLLELLARLALDDGTG